MSRVNTASLALASGAMVIALGGVAIGAPGDGGVIRGCYETDTGALSVIDEGQTCPMKTHKPLTWNMQGAPGPAGPQGPDGTATSPVLKALSEWEPPAEAPPTAPRRITPSERKTAIAGIGYRESSRSTVRFATPPQVRIMTAQVGSLHGENVGTGLHGPTGPDVAVRAAGWAVDDLSLLPDAFGVDRAFTAIEFPRPVIGCTVTATPTGVNQYHPVAVHGVGQAAPHELLPRRRGAYTVTLHSEGARAGNMHVIVVCDPRNALPPWAQIQVAQPVQPPVAAPVE